MDWIVPITAITPPSSLLPLSVVSPLPGARQDYGDFGFVFVNVRLLRCIVADIEILSYFSKVVNYEISILEINLSAKNRKWKVFVLSNLRIY